MLIPFSIIFTRRIATIPWKTERHHSVTFQSPFIRLNGRYISVTIQSPFSAIQCHSVTIPSPVDHVPVFYYRCVIFVISLLFSRYRNQRKRPLKQLFIIFLQKRLKFYSHQNTKQFTLLKLQNNWSFSSSITHTHIYKHNWSSLLHREV